MGAATNYRLDSFLEVILPRILYLYSFPSGNKRILFLVLRNAPLN